jgi:hypothetical protein
VHEVERFVVEHVVVDRRDLNLAIGIALAGSAEGLLAHTVI